MKELSTMRRHKTMFLVLGAAFALTAAKPVADGLFTVESKVNWQENRIEMELTIQVDRLDNHARSRAEDIFAVNSVHWLRQGMGDLVVDAQKNMSAQWQSITTQGEASLASRLQQMLHQLDSSFSTNFHTFTSRYSLQIYPDLIEFWTHDTLFIPHIPPQIEISDTPPYTGLLIYAAGPRIVHGEPGVTAALQPALFPRIFDQDMNLLLDSRYVDPVYLKRWGVIGYHDADELQHDSPRVGAFPLRTRALAFFGFNRSDILLSRSAAKRITSSLGGRQALQQGRILVLLGQD